MSTAMESITCRTIDEGFVLQLPADGSSGSIASGPRVVALPSGELICSCVRSSALGTNDFCPVMLRSHDLGSTWVEQGPAWPHLMGRSSLFTAISREAEERLLMFGLRFPIDELGESFWSNELGGMKPNDLVWAMSRDQGRSWSEPRGIAIPVPGAAEGSIDLCVTQTNRWIGPYAIENCWQRAAEVDCAQTMVTFSDDRGQTWTHRRMLSFPPGQSKSAEPSMVELSDGRLLGVAWHIGLNGKPEHPIAYAVSSDGGDTWEPTRSTGVVGQATGLSAWSDARAVLVYNRRIHSRPGIGLAIVRPTDDGMDVELDEMVWFAENATMTNASGHASSWQDFAYGEPSVTVLPDNSLYLTFWCIQPQGSGIRWVRLELPAI
ncbi:MAG: exo-alpha-sialidase [Pirellulales bacterium]|nr:exo-alpha-sialidase [Pirellulales bacterium]